MRKYLSQEKREKVRYAGIFLSHFIPVYSTIRMRRMFREGNERIAREGFKPSSYRENLASAALSDVVGSALLVYSVAVGALPLAIWGVMLKGVPAVFETHVRSEWEREKSESDGAGGESAAASAYPAADKFGGPQKERYRLEPAEA